MKPSTPQPRTCRKAPAEDDAQRLVRAIPKLPARLRDVFLLHRMAGMTYIEIGLHLGMTSETVQALLAAALVRLTRALPVSDLSSENQTTRCVHRAQSTPKEGMPHRSAVDRDAACGRSGKKSRPIKPRQRSEVLTPTRGTFTISGGELESR